MSPARGRQDVARGMLLGSRLAVKVSVLRRGGEAERWFWKVLEEWKAQCQIFSELIRVLGEVGGGRGEGTC